MKHLTSTQVFSIVVILLTFGIWFYQTQLGLIDQEFFDAVARKAIERDGELIVALEIPMNPAFKLEVDSVLAEMNQSMSGS